MSDLKLNQLFYGDNLTIMQQEMGKDSVDLIYLDPPFNSKKTYNLMYHRLNGSPVPEQVEAFCDTWVLDSEKEEAARSMPLLMREQGVENYYIEFWRMWVGALRHTQPHLLAYLIYMVQRLLHMRSILRPTGSIYLHCDPTASHYIKVMMDGIFGHQNFRNEIIWKRTYAHSGAARWGDVHDSILFYTKSDSYIWNRGLQSHDENYLASKYRHEDERGQYRFVVLTAPGVRHGASGQPWHGYNPTDAGRHWSVPKRAINLLAQEGVEIPTGLHEQLELLLNHGMIRFGKSRNGRQGSPEAKHYLSVGQPVQDVITDISPLNSQADERLGYPTQKPLALLHRIIRTSSNPGDVVFDPFCGCGTTIYSASMNNRRWIGCDIAILPIRIVQRTLAERYKILEGDAYTVSGIPASVEQAEDLLDRDPVQFAHWFVEAIGGFPTGHSALTQIDGRIYYETAFGTREMLLEVKGNARPTDVRRMKALLERESSAELAAILLGQPPSRPVIEEAKSAGEIVINSHRYERIQLLSIRDFFERKQEVKSPISDIIHGEKLGQMALL